MVAEDEGLREMSLGKDGSRNAMQIMPGMGISFCVQ